MIGMTAVRFGVIDDLVLTWIGTPVGWLRQVVRVLSVDMVTAMRSLAGPTRSQLGCTPPRR